MKILKAIVLVLGVFFTQMLLGQDVKNQSDIIRSSFSPGKYTVVSSFYETKEMIIDDILLDKNQPNEHFEVIFQQFPNESTKKDQYFPDNIAFPATYIESAYEGDEKDQKEIGYVIRKGRPAGKKRMVFLNEYIFLLDSWENKDSYSLNTVLKLEGTKEENDSKKKKKKGGFGSFLNKIKEAKVKQKNGGNDTREKLKKEILQPYLDKAFEKQKTYYAQWIKNPDHAKLEQYLKDLEKLMDLSIRNQNEKIKNSPEYKRMKAMHAYLDGKAANESKGQVTIYNKTGKDIYLFEEGSGNSSRITPNSRISVNCSKNYYYNFNPNSSYNTQCYSANGACGSSVTVQ